MNAHMYLAFVVKCQVFGSQLEEFCEGSMYVRQVRLSPTFVHRAETFKQAKSDVIDCFS